MASEMVTDPLAPTVNGVDESLPPVVGSESDAVSSEASKALVNG
jgi:hypothetical protein